MTSKTDLLPCPCCGNENVKEFAPEEWGDSANPFWKIMCSSCVLSLCGTHRYMNQEAWNNRAERTCKLEGTIRHDYYHGGTEYEHTFSCGHKVTWSDDEAPDYCPWCGAKVVD